MGKKGKRITNNKCNTDIINLNNSIHRQCFQLGTKQEMSGRKNTKYKKMFRIIFHLHSVPYAHTCKCQWKESPLAAPDRIASLSIVYGKQSFSIFHRKILHKYNMKKKKKCSKRGSYMNIHFFFFSYRPRNLNQIGRCCNNLTPEFVNELWIFQYSGKYMGRIQFACAGKHCLHSEHVYPGWKWANASANVCNT